MKTVGLGEPVISQKLEIRELGLLKTRRHWCNIEGIPFWPRNSLLSSD
jgi:hypothetical protein